MRIFLSYHSSEFNYVNMNKDNKKNVEQNLFN